MEQWSIFTQEPAAALWLSAAALLLFGSTFSRAKNANEQAWTWFRRLIEAFVKALAFIVLMVMLHFILTSSFNAFNKIYASFVTEGSQSNQAWQHWWSAYGDAIVQKDLMVTQFIEHQETKALPTTTPSGPVLYLDTKTEQPVPQNSITGFRGHVTMNMVDREHLTDSFIGYTLSARYEYVVTNATGQQSRAVFSFPLQKENRLYRDIHVTRNGQELTTWRVVDGTITWEEAMQPGQRENISIAYVTSGTNSFLFEMEQSREVIDFELTVALDTFDAWPLMQPESGGIQLDTKAEMPYKIFTWTIDHAILAPRLSVTFPQGWPYAPYYAMTASLPYAARALILFASLTVITLVICGIPVSLRQVALLGLLFVLPFLVLMSGTIPLPGSISRAEYATTGMKLLPVLSLLPLVLSFLSLRRMPRLPLVLMLILMVLFLTGYAFIGLLLDEQKRNAAENAVQVGMIAYTFAITLFVNVRSLTRSRAVSENTRTV